MNNNQISLGIINFLNCMPFIIPFQQWGLENINLSLGYPTLINGLMKDGQLHSAPISSIEYIKNKDKYVLIDTACISSNGEVGSVILFSKYNFNELAGKTIGLPYNSATSLVLLKILLLQNYIYDDDVEFLNHKYEKNLDEALTADFDAVLYIGDAALIENNNQQNNYYKYDLGLMWKKLTGYPCVFGTWVADREWATKNPEDYQWLKVVIENAYKTGKEKYIDTIAETYSEKLGLSQDIIRDYLLNKIKYDYTDYHLMSLEVFENLYNDLIQ